MSQIKDYKLLVGSSAEKLAEQVRAHLSDGWQPFQNPIMFQISPTGYNLQLVFLQAVIKY